LRRERVRQLGSLEEIFEYFKKMPQASVNMFVQETHMSTPTIRVAFNDLTNMGIVEEISGKKRDKFYGYKKYLALLEQGTEPF